MAAQGTGRAVAGAAAAAAASPKADCVQQEVRFAPLSEDASGPRGWASRTRPGTEALSNQDRHEGFLADPANLKEADRLGGPGRRPGRTG